MNYTGAEVRFKILEDEFSNRVGGFLSQHRWSWTIRERGGDGEFILIELSRGSHVHDVSLIFSESMDTANYQNLDAKSELILTRRAPVQSYLEQHAKKITTSIVEISALRDSVFRWNSDFEVDGTVSDGIPRPKVTPASVIDVLADDPLTSIWLHVEQLRSRTVAARMLRTRFELEGAPLEDAARDARAQGVAFSVRNATDYFGSVTAQSPLTQRVLSLYYGTMAFVSAEALSRPDGPADLREVEASTRQGHGLYLIDGDSDGAEGMLVGVNSQGFFPTWMKVLKNPAAKAFPAKKARTAEQVTKYESCHYSTMSEIMSRLPELGPALTAATDTPPLWLNVNLDSDASPPRSSADFSYARLSDRTGRAQLAMVRALAPNSMSEVEHMDLPSEVGVHFRAKVQHSGLERWWDAVPTHNSSFTNHATMIAPLFGSREFRVIATVLLYALSILVRYRPSVWRQIQEGDADHLREVISVFLTVCERVLPQEFLSSITGRRVVARQGGSWF